MPLYRRTPRSRSSTSAAFPRTPYPHPFHSVHHCTVRTRQPCRPPCFPLDVHCALRWTVSFCPVICLPFARLMPAATHWYALCSPAPSVPHTQCFDCNIYWSPYLVGPYHGYVLFIRYLMPTHAHICSVIHSSCYIYIHLLQLLPIYFTMCLVPLPHTFPCSCHCLDYTYSGSPYLIWAYRRQRNKY